MKPIEIMWNIAIRTRNFLPHYLRQRWATSEGRSKRLSTNLNPMKTLTPSFMGIYSSLPNSKKIRPCLAQSYHHLSYYTERYHSTKMSCVITRRFWINPANLNIKYSSILRWIDCNEDTEGRCSLSDSVVARIFFLPISLATSIFGTNVGRFFSMLRCNAFLS